MPITAARSHVSMPSRGRAVGSVRDARAKAIVFLGAVVFLGGCTDLNVTPRTDGAAVLDAPFDAFDAPSGGGGAGAAGHAGDAAGGLAGTSPAATGGVGGEGRAGAGGDGRAGAGGEGRAGAGGDGRAGAGGQAPAAGGNGGRGGAAAGGRPGAGGGSGAGGAAASGGGGAGGMRGGGGAPGSGGATAGCPSTTVNPCVPNMVDTQHETCCEKGTRTHSRTCNPTTCEWGSFGAWSSCSVAAACDPGKTSACANNDPCGNRVCSGACQWGGCVPKAGAECLYLNPDTNVPGADWRCGSGANAGKSNFCLSDCNWSNTWDMECSSCC